MKKELEDDGDIRGCFLILLCAGRRAHRDRYSDGRGGELRPRVVVGAEGLALERARSPLELARSREADEAETAEEDEGGRAEGLDRRERAERDVGEPRRDHLQDVEHLCAS